MHGVRRGAKPSQAEQEREARRSAINADLIRKALQLRNKPLPKPLTDDFLSNYHVVDAAVEANPDEYTLWSFRREVLLAHALPTAPNLDDMFKSELALTMRALRRHPKAYPAWQHRLWLLGDSALEPHLSPGLREAARDEERMMSALVLSKDGRNFHGWAHRMRVRDIVLQHDPSQSRSLDEDEMQFVESMVNADFANYSAWHHRSVLLTRLQDVGPDVIERELEFVKQAFYTEPDVQSVWFYHRWLLAGAPKPGQQVTESADCNLLEKQLGACDELLDIEPEARLALQEKALILLQLRRGNDCIETLDILEKLVSVRPIDLDAVLLHLY